MRLAEQTTVKPRSFLAVQSAREGNDLGKTRGKQKGTLQKEGQSWIGYWYEEVRSASTGLLKWHKFSKKICDAVEPDAVTKRMRALTEKEVRRRFDEQILSKLDVANTNPQSLATVKEFVDRKFEPCLVLKKRKGQEHYRGMLKNHVLPAIGSKRLRDVKQDDIQELILQKVAKGYSSQTVVHVRNVITTVFKKAKAIGWYTGDLPTADLEMPQLEHRKRIALSKEQLVAFLQALPYPVYVLVMTASVAGLRRGEIAGLRWKHVNLTEEIITVDGENVPPRSVSVRENYVWVYGKDLRVEDRGGKYQTLKTKSSKRIVPVTGIADLLAGWHTAAKFAGPEDPVFAGRNGTPLDLHNILEDYMRPIMVKLKMPVFSWHDLRHTNSTLSEKGGISLTNRQRILGHADDKMTSHYSHADLEQARGVLEELGCDLLKLAPVPSGTVN